MYRADLHCHSTCSDGTSTPIELLELAKEKELSALAITDHDTLNAYTDKLFDKAKELGSKALCRSGVFNTSQEIPHSFTWIWDGENP